MRIGILQTDSVLAPFVPAHGDYPDMFRNLLADPAVRPPQQDEPAFLDIDVQGQHFPDPACCDGYVITGSRHSVYDELPWIPALADFVRQALTRRRRVVGICFGHQLIAHYFGGETRAAEVGWCVGVQPSRVVADAPWMDPPARSLRLLASHKDQVVRLPPGAQRIAVGELCPESGFVLGDALTFQGHPEFTAAYAGDLLDHRQALLGEALYGAGKASLTERTDRQVVARWILNFLAQPGPCPGPCPSPCP